MLNFTLENKGTVAEFRIPLRLFACDAIDIRKFVNSTSCIMTLFGLVSAADVLDANVVCICRGHGERPLCNVSCREWGSLGTKKKGEILVTRHKISKERPMP